MSFHYTRSRTIPSLLLLTIAVCLWSLQIRTLIDERALSSQLWPADIHATVISLLGGSSTPSLLNGLRFSLTWPPLLLRCIVFTVGTLLLHSMLLHCRTRTKTTDAANTRSANTLTVTIQNAAVASRPAAAFAALWLMLWNTAPFLPSESLAQFLTAAAPATFGLSLALALAALCHLPDVSTYAAAPQLPSTPELSAAAPRGRFRKATPILLIVVAAAAWQCISFQMNSRLYHNLLVPHGDSAMYEEHLWNVWHGKGFRSYLDQGLFLGEHIQVIHLLLLPLHMLWPHYLLLEWTSSACLAACAFPIYSITLRHAGCRRAAFWMAISWLFYTPMHFLDIAIDLKTLRPSCYGLFALFLAIDFAERKRHRSSTICFLLALLTQEDFALITGPTGFVFALTEFRIPVFQRDRSHLRWAAALATASVAWVLLAVLVVIPAFRGGEAVHYSRYFGDLGRSPSELIASTFSQPDKVASVLFSSRTLLYILLLAGPIAFLPFKSPLRLAAGLATFTMLSLIQLGADQNGAVVELPPIPFHHFHAPLLPVLYWAAASGLKNTHRNLKPANSGRNSQSPKHSATTLNGLLNRLSALYRPILDSPATAARFACISAACTALTGSLMPCGTAFWSKESPFGWQQLYAPGPRGTELEKIIRQLPASSRIASTDFIHTRLTHFERSYDYSNYLRAINNYRPGVPPDTDFIIIDTTHRYSTIRSASQVPELQPQPSSAPAPQNQIVPGTPPTPKPADQASNDNHLWELLPELSRSGFLVLRRGTSVFPAPGAGLLPNPPPETIPKNMLPQSR